VKQCRNYAPYTHNSCQCWNYTSYTQDSCQTMLKLNILHSRLMSNNVEIIHLILTTHVKQCWNYTSYTHERLMSNNAEIIHLKLTTHVKQCWNNTSDTHDTCQTLPKLCTLHLQFMSILKLYILYSRLMSNNVEILYLTFETHVKQCWNYTSYSHDSCQTNLKLYILHSRLMWNNAQIIMCFFIEW
jgi:hypothetical protein